jgi:protein-S-isoprenylcysteine O-methyltransferase Ste14
MSQRLLALIPAGFLFALLIPFVLARLAPLLDERLGVPSLNAGWSTLILGSLLIAIGVLYAVWSIAAQIFRARGTPLPMMATQKLIISAPFDQCRNPMSFGTILFYLGISIIAGSLSAIIIVILLSILLMVYIKRIEEKELEARFGDEYREYKDTTPFLLPRIRRKA